MASTSGLCGHACVDWVGARAKIEKKKNIKQKKIRTQLDPQRLGAVNTCGSDPGRVDIAAGINEHADTVDMAPRCGNAHQVARGAVIAKKKKKKKKNWGRQPSKKKKKKKNTNKP
jgi:hypothetical protein